MSIILDALKKSQEKKQGSAHTDKEPAAAPSSSSGIFNPTPNKPAAEVQPAAQPKRVRTMVLVLILAFGIGFVAIGNFAPQIMSMISGQSDFVIKPKAGDYKIDPAQIQKLVAEQKNKQAQSLANGSEPLSAKEKQEIEKINALKSEALGYYEERKFDKAVYVFKQLVNLAPTDATAYNNFGLSLKKLGKLNEAKQAYNTALALRPEYPEALNNLAVIELAEHLYTEAKQHLKKAIAVDPDYLDPYLHLAICLEKSGDLQQAETFYEDFLDRSEGKINRKVRLQIENRLARLKEDL